MDAVGLPPFFIAPERFKGERQRAAWRAIIAEWARDRV